MRGLDIVPYSEDSFWAIIDEIPLGSSVPFESAVEEEHHVYQTMFFDHPKGMGVDVNSRSVIKMRIEKGESTN